MGVPCSVMAKCTKVPYYPIVQQHNVQMCRSVRMFNAMVDKITLVFPLEKCCNKYCLDNVCLDKRRAQGTSVHCTFPHCTLSHCPAFHWKNVPCPPVHYSPLHPLSIRSRSILSTIHPFTVQVSIATSSPLPGCA